MCVDKYLVHISKCRGNKLQMQIKHSIPYLKSSIPYLESMLSLSKFWHHLCCFFSLVRCTLALLSWCRVPFPNLSLGVVLLWVCLWLAAQWYSHNSFCTWARIHPQENKSGICMQFIGENTKCSICFCPGEKWWHISPRFFLRFSSYHRDKKITEIYYLA